MINIVLYQPEIPPNTGNIIRLCGNTNSHLHLIYPLAFDLDVKNLRRAGLDYHDLTNITKYKCWDDFFISKQKEQIVAFTTKSQKSFAEIEYSDNCYLLFGPETRGLPSNIINSISIARIPMQESSRSINLSNSVAIGLYEALRQNEYRQLK